MVPLTPRVMGTPQSPSSTFGVITPSGVQVTVPKIALHFPQLVVSQPSLEVTVECVQVQWEYLLQLLTMTNTVDVSIYCKLL